MKIQTIILIILIGSVVLVSGCTSQDTNNTSAEPQPETAESKITSDMIRIESEVFDRTPEGTPLYDAGYYASIETADDTYFIPDTIYQPLIQYFGTGGTDKPFYAKIEKRQVLLNPDASVIIEIFDLEGNPIT